MLSVIKAVEPTNELESLLAAQMAAVHVAMMHMAALLSCATTLKQQDSAERAMNKLARTFTTQLEALKRYRTGGQQKITIEHVHVHEGGQAIMGIIEGGGGSSKRVDQPHAPRLKDAPRCGARTRRGGTPAVPKPSPRCRMVDVACMAVSHLGLPKEIAMPGSAGTTRQRA